MSASFWRRNLICRFQLCQTFRQVDGDTHIWGECSVCGKQVGKISREAIRRYIDLTEALENRKAGLADATKSPPVPQTAIGERQ